MDRGAWWANSPRGGKEWNRTGREKKKKHKMYFSECYFTVNNQCDNYSSCLFAGCGFYVYHSIFFNPLFNFWSSLCKAVGSYFPDRDGTGAPCTGSAES